MIKEQQLTIKSEPAEKFQQVKITNLSMYCNKQQGRACCHCVIIETAKHPWIHHKNLIIIKEKDKCWLNPKS